MIFLGCRSKAGKCLELPLGQEKEKNRSGVLFPAWEKEMAAEIQRQFSPLAAFLKF